MEVTNGSQIDLGSMDDILGRSILAWILLPRLTNFISKASRVVYLFLKMVESAPKHLESSEGVCGLQTASGPCPHIGKEYDQLSLTLHKVCNGQDQTTSSFSARPPPEFSRDTPSFFYGVIHHHDKHLDFQQNPRFSKENFQFTPFKYSQNLNNPKL
ncbi:hypothetical protein PVAP13_2KG298402 [Panicum virgatum]|uniref:Uncharacterized protein n=1 Tax=Panicum virgatum TaxID=38727 RepID=A0A8T0W832_PANVG|nr:hypothetical protein PVAP13_2KG298402 [Panicum virgatum]